MTGPPRNFAAILRARRGYLSTMGEDGRPRVIPVCFTWAGDVIYTAVDGKPKSARQPARIRQIESNEEVCFVVDRWDEDWSRLAWLQARGSARKLPAGEETEKAKAALKDKYEQYREVAIDGPVIRIDVERWLGWP